jgi:hypothetical protein
MHAENRDAGQTLVPNLKASYFLCKRLGVPIVRSPCLPISTHLSYKAGRRITRVKSLAIPQAGFIRALPDAM